MSVIADMVALPMSMKASLASARGSYTHSAFNVAKGAVSGAVSLANRSGK